jgi:uncharacterized protein YsxB (DUF464 family)
VRMVRCKLLIRHRAAHCRTMMESRRVHGAETVCAGAAVTAVLAVTALDRSTWIEPNAS